MNNTVVETSQSNADFLAKHARAGRVVLSGGEAFLDRAIRRAQRHLSEEKRWAKWSHAFVLQGVRMDGHHWVIESDMQVVRKHILFGVQENRLAKYHDEELYPWLAVLDFGLSEPQVATVVREGLELVATKTRYSIRELFGTLIAMRKPELRGQENVLARDHSFYCSALVCHLFSKVGVELLPGVNDKNATPKDFVNSPVPHAMRVLDRHAEPNKLGQIADRLRERAKQRRNRRAKPQADG